MELVTQWVS